MTHNEIFEGQIKQAANQLKIAEAKARFYRLLLVMGCSMDTSFRVASSLDFKRVLNSKEFRENEKREIKKIEKSLQGIIY
jgi:hypothetical protein